MGRHSVGTLPQRQSAPDVPSREVARKGRGHSLLVPLALLIIGLCVLLYPVVATQLSNLHQREVAEQYSQLLQQKPEGELTEQLMLAEEYNRSSVSGTLRDPWRDAEGNGGQEYDAYMKMLSIGDVDSPMSQIVIPAAGVNLPIYHGTGHSSLDRGVGHLWGTSLPVGGPGTHSVLTGHTGLTRATMFDNLTEMKEGSVFYLNTFGRKMKYQVDDISVVKPDEVDSLAVVPGEDLVTLITCTPYGINDHRLLVRGFRVPMDPAEEVEAYSTPPLEWQWWMKAILAFVGCCLLLLLALFIRAAVRRMRHSSGRQQTKEPKS
ncbi:class C sortase [Corynebacterium sp. CCM 9204]|uniref:class C sortase n=1 Tax=Corynebacterium sp. CCM 9204 TaxID=3057616 RepID=UPI003525709B